MRLHEIYDRLQSFAPKSLSDEYCQKYGAYDNSGILLDCGREIEKILFALDFSATALQRAEEVGANLIVTHHPAIYAKIGNILSSEPQGKNLQRAIAGGISVISMHLNFDCATGGIDECLMRGIGGRDGKVMEPLSAGGYGRVYDVPPRRADALAEEIRTTFSAKRVLCYGEEKKVKRVASFCGAGASEEAILWAKENNADCVVSSDFKHHILTMSAEREMSVIVLTHYAAEIYGFEKIYRQLKDRLGAESEFFRDDRWM